MTRRALRICTLLTLLALSGCVSVGSLGMITKSSIDPAAVLHKAHRIEEVGPAEGQACRFFVLAVIPWGNSDVQTAVDKALGASGGDALVNVTTSTSLYGFVPVYNILSFTCTTVKGTAVRIEDLSAPPTAAATPEAGASPAATPTPAASATPSITPSPPSTATPRSASPP
jgi:hypothetical protein